MTYTERAFIALLRRQEAHKAEREYRDAERRRDTRAMHRAHRAFVLAKARLAVAEANL